MKQQTVLRFMVFSLALGGCFSSCKKEERLPAIVSKSPTLQTSAAMVTTPYGLVPASKVFEVDNKTIVKANGGHLQILDIATGKLVKDLRKLSPEEMASTKTNPYIYAAHLRSQYNGVRDVIPMTDNNPVAAATSTSNTGLTNYPAYYIGADQNNIQSFSTNWTVPKKPLDTVNLATTFLWNGLDGGALQPVLQWSEGTGPNYTIANWYFVDGNYFHGQFLPVSPGTNLQGLITFVSNTNDTTWTYKESFVGYPQADVTIVRNSEATGLAECFEPYTSLMSAWPNQPYEAMRNIKLTLRSGAAPDSIQWYGINDGPRTTPTGYNSVIVSNSSSAGEVRFYFGDGTSITPDSTYKISSAVGSDKVLDVTGGATANGTKVELYSNNTPTSTNQEWQFIALGSGYYKILPLNAPGKALTVKGGLSKALTQVEIDTDSGSASQKWKISPLGNGFYKLSPACAPNLVLDVYGDNSANGTKIEIYPPNDGIAQRFTFNLQ